MLMVAGMDGSCPLPTVVTRTLLPGRGWVESAEAPADYIPAYRAWSGLGGDELRVRAWLRARLSGGC
jgi:hypothetical protein